MCTTVVINVRNGAKFIEKALRSIQRSMVTKKVTLLIVDNMSSDNTWEVCQNTLVDMNCVEIVNYVCLLKAQTLFAARNVAIDIVDTKFISFLDSDDEFEERKIETALEIINTFSVGAVFSVANLLSATSSRLSREVKCDRKISKSIGIVQSSRYGVEYVYPWVTNFFKTEILKSTRFREEFNIIGDMVIVNEIARSYGVAFSSETFGKVLLRDDSESKRHILLFSELLSYYREELVDKRIAVGCFLFLIGRQILTTIGHISRRR